MARLDRKNVWCYVAILAVVSAAFGNSLLNGLVSDDIPQILNNPDIKSLKNIPILFSTGVWHTKGYSGGLYRPVAFLSWMLEYALVGPAPFLYHLDNVILHFFCSAMVFLVLGLFIKDGKTPFIASLLFAAHPVHSEAVAWVACRMELLYAFFSLLALWFFIRRNGRAGYLFASLFSYAIALLSKEAAISLPLLLLLYIYFFEQGNYGKGRLVRTIKPLYPYFVVTAAYIVLRSSIVNLYDNSTSIFANYDSLTPYSMFLVMCRAFYEYIRLAFLPVNLRLEYIINPDLSLFSFKVLLPISVFLVASLLAVRGKLNPTLKLVIFSVLWFFAALLPVSNIIPSGIVLAERAMYLPSVGSCLIMGLIVSKTQYPGDKYRHIAIFCLTLILVMFTFIATKANLSWSNKKLINEEALKLVRHRINVFPNNPGSYIVLASINLDLGEFGSEPEAALLKAKSIDPSDSLIFYMLAKIYDKRSQPEKAMTEITSAIRIKPEASYYNFAGLILTKLKRYPEAAAMFDKAIKIEPAVSCYYINMGNLLVESGSDEPALAFFEKGAVLDPNNHDAYLGQGIVLNSQRRFDEAVVKLRKAVDLQPSNADLHRFLGVALKDAGRDEEARMEFIESERLRKNNTKD